MIARTSRKRSRRRGYGLAEVAMAVMIVIAAMTFTVKALGLAASERKSADRRLCAGLAASNLLERATALPFGEVSEAKVKSLADAEHADRALPGADWQVAVVDESAGPVASKRITVRLTWKQRSENLEAPVRLSAWIYQGPKGGRP
jgi:hypothetical protein